MKINAAQALYINRILQPFESNPDLNEKYFTSELQTDFFVWTQGGRNFKEDFANVSKILA